MADDSRAASQSKWLSKFKMGDRQEVTLIRSHLPKLYTTGIALVRRFGKGRSSGRSAERASCGGAGQRDADKASEQPSFNMPLDHSIPVLVQLADCAGSRL